MTQTLYSILSEVVHGTSNCLQSLCCFGRPPSHPENFPVCTRSEPEVKNDLSQKPSRKSSKRKQIRSKKHVKIHIIPSTSSDYLYDYPKEKKRFIFKKSSKKKKKSKSILVDRSKYTEKSFEETNRNLQVPKRSSRNLCTACNQIKSYVSLVTERNDSIWDFLRCHWDQSRSASTPILLSHGRNNKFKINMELVDGKEVNPKERGQKSFVKSKSRLTGSEEFMWRVNDLADPHHAYVYVFPLVALFDSAFAAQYLLCTSAGEWLNAVLKWLLAEQRPYWWVRETDYYPDGERPSLRQFAHTCETGPGCPSGHAMSAMTELLLLSMWISHVMADRKLLKWWLRWPLWPAIAVGAALVGAARMFVATHFPHQVVLGAICGLALCPALCIYVCDPYVWGRAGARRRRWHVAAALAAIASGFAVYWGMRALGVDPQWSVKLAFKWCEDPSRIKVTTTPLFALVEACGSLLGWAVFVTPSVAKYRYNTKQRSLLVALSSGAGAHYLLSQWQLGIPSDDVTYFYLNQFAFYFAKTFVFLRAVPFVATLPYRIGRKVKAT